MSEKKKISIMVPCYNEEENVVPLSEAVIATLEKDYYLLITVQRTKQGKN